MLTVTSTSSRRLLPSQIILRHIAPRPCSEFDWMAFVLLQSLVSSAYTISPHGGAHLVHLNSSSAVVVQVDLWMPLSLWYVYCLVYQGLNSLLAFSLERAITSIFAYNILEATYAVKYPHAPFLKQPLLLLLNQKLVQQRHQLQNRPSRCYHRMYVLSIWLALQPLLLSNL